MLHQILAAVSADLFVNTDQNAWFHETEGHNLGSVLMNVTFTVSQRNCC
jgi:hypothetical protein